MDLVYSMLKKLGRYLVYTKLKRSYAQTRYILGENKFGMDLVYVRVKKLGMELVYTRVKKQADIWFTLGEKEGMHRPGLYQGKISKVQSWFILG